MALNTLAHHLEENGRGPEALDRAKESARLYRSLAKQSPAAFLPDLAMALSTVAGRLPDSASQDAHAALVALGMLLGLVLGLMAGPVAGLGFGLGVGVGFGAPSGRRYLVFVLCSWGKLPWRPAVFLDWACAAGLMRSSGSAYQFRHRELQQWLARHPCPPPL
jgi:hypothetical protein